MVDSGDARSALYRIAEQQAGYFTAAQALEAGYSYAAQSYHRSVGNWCRDGWGVYRLARFPHTPGEDLVKLMLWSRDRSERTQAVVSHESALQVYELSDVLSTRTHLTVPSTFRKPAPTGVVLHRADVDRAEVVERDGFRITSPLRTLLDIARSDVSREHLVAAVDEAIARGLVRRGVLREAFGDSAPDVRELASRRTER